jgi:Tfp pilus assembly protein PilF
VIVIVGVLPCTAQNRSNPRASYSIYGSVRDDASHDVLENVRVDLKQSTGATLSTAFTRGNGDFEFDNLSAGEYIIEIVLKDYEPVRETVSILNSSHEVPIFLARPLTSANSGSGATISAHQLGAPHKAHDEFNKGMELMYAKADYRGAIAQFQRAIKDYPTYYEAYTAEGEAYIRLGDTDPAEEALRTSIDLSSGRYSEALFALASLLTGTKRYSEAVPVARQSMSVDAASWQGPYELARALAALRQFDEAEKAALQARDLKPNNAPAYLLLANIHLERHDYPALLKDIEGYLRLVPKGPEADQARKNADDLRAAMQHDENRTPATAQAKQTPTHQNEPGEGAPPRAVEKEAPPDPDASGLPSLPPPFPSNP